MTTTAFCPICHLNQCSHLSPHLSSKIPTWVIPTAPIPDNLHPTPIPTELSILRSALLAERVAGMRDAAKLLSQRPLCGMLQSFRENAVLVILTAADKVENGG